MAVQNEVWVPIFTLAVGYIASFSTEMFRNRQTAKREQAARDDQKRALVAERHELFQRQTILDLQEALAQLARAAGACHHEDTMAYYNTGLWKKQGLSKEWNDGYTEAQRRTSLLVVRVADDDTRRLVKQVRAQAAASVLSQDEHSGAHAILTMMQLLEESNERMGQLLRTMDAAEISNHVIGVTQAQ